jgi:ABC-type Na+ efflux pump permease subunit
VPEIQPWVVTGRITGIIGMGLTISLGILFLLGALWVPGVVALLLTVPFFVLMVAVERSKAARAMSGKPPAALEEP